MKKLLILVILAAMLCSISIPAFAASDTYELDEVGLTVSIPADYSVITKDTPENSPIFSQWGTTKAELMAKGICLNARSNLYEEEIVVDMTEDEENSLSLYSDSELLGFAELWVDLYRSLGYPLYKYDIYQHAQTRFIRLYYTNTDQTVHAVQYYTVYNHKQINFTFKSYEGSWSSRQETTIKTIVDSIRFANMSSGIVSGEDTEPFVYTDQESGLTFTVPANWKEEDFYGDRERLDVKFGSTESDGLSIIYSSEDFWGELTPDKKIGLTREDVNNDLLSEEFVAQMYSVTRDEVSTVYYNGRRYYKCETRRNVEIDGIEIPVTMTMLTHIDNGWMYAFTFGGTSDEALYSDFEKLIESVKYPAVYPEAGSNVPDKEPSEPNKADTNQRPDLDLNTRQDDNQDYTVLIVLGAIFAALGVVVVVIVLRKKKKNEYEEIMEFCAEPSQPQKPEEKKILCPKCGQLLPEYSAFCHFCGTSVTREDNAQ